MKICGLTLVEDARAAAAAGADYLGATLSEGFARSVRPESARAFVAPGGPPLVAVLVNPSVEDALERGQTAGASILQLHGEEPPELLDELRGRSRFDVWKAVRPRTPDELRWAIARYAPHVDGLLVDGWHPEHRGGSGARLDVDMVARVRASLPAGVMFIAAGGLSAGTVADAIAALAPDVVDVSSGVEGAPGRKDHGKVEAFIRAARGAAAFEGAR